ncbi:putative late blight resistance protein homolog R1A-10 isoform X2 [Solanum tuberosum]|uniref:putative late blight resistance protein homolog R1A-10 isoform X2 n=1 Tax=Solanum tuberosum TaxID=4113 RepID=UPI000739FD77|nr:PREDICTED: putative late blight resistance protein homolog R1A-10 isoform X2 [Solanum tuberosum]
MAYAAVTSLMRTIHQSMELTGCDLQPFYEKLKSLRAILEKSCNIMGDHEGLTILEVEIAEVAYTTEDMVDSESRNVFLAQNLEERSRAMWEIFFVLEQALECIASTVKQWMAASDSMKDLKPQTSSLVSLPEHAVEQPENIMVGRENEFEMMLDQLARGGRELEVVSIVGMGGIGKTTLATKLYSDPYIMSRFDIRAKATVSQEYCVRNVILGLLPSISDEPDDQLADRLQKHLKGRRYLVVIDDIWTTEAWDDIKLCFPDCYNGSRILLTTRNVEVAECARSGKPPHHMRLMNFDESWNLLHKKIFEKEGSYSPEFENIGKQIALKCGGLPLAITVIAGLLSKISKTLGVWQYVAENVSSVVSTDLEAKCMRVLALSYHHLPSHLKPCFLYFAIFAEDEQIYVNKLVELWAVEGFLNEEEGKSIEEVATTCINELIDRSLIFIHNFSFRGTIESCGMHDVTRELCLREARNMNFVNVIRGKSYQNSCEQSMQCSFKSRNRIRIHNEKKLVWCCSSEAHSIIMLGGFKCVTLALSFKLVRVLDLGLTICPFFPSGVLSLFHLRYLSLCFKPCLKQYRGSKEAVPSSIIDIPLSISSLCYLQTFKLYLPFPNSSYPFILPSEILTMPQLRKLHMGWNYLQSHEPTENRLVLKSLQCLNQLNPRYCTGSFFRLFPNLKKLKVFGVPEDFRNHKDLYDFRYLYQLEKLTFGIYYSPIACFLKNTAPSGSTPQDPLRFQTRFGGTAPPTDVPTLLLPPPDAFPQNLKSLTFRGKFSLAWKDLSIVGKLSKLEVLKLSDNAFIGEEWEVVEEGFPHLKFLFLDRVYIRYWRASSDHFPYLERLFLKDCYSLDSIPRDFADITTLALIDISDCKQSVGNSAKQIQQDIQDNYGSSIEVHTRESFCDNR